MGKLAEIKTKETGSSVEDFINAIKHEEKRKDSFLLIQLMHKATEEKPKMWVVRSSGLGNLTFPGNRGACYYYDAFILCKAHCKIYSLLEINKGLFSSLGIIRKHHKKTV